MGNVGRGFYLAFPFLLTLIAFVLLIIVLLNQQDKSNSFLTSLYFLRLDTHNIDVSANVQNVNVNVDVSKVAGLDAYYDIGLWNYCKGPGLNVMPDFCSPRQAGYYFNPIDVLNLENTPIPTLVPAEWQKALDTYKSVSQWLFAAYIVAIISTIVTFLLGILTFCLSRISALMTSLAAFVAALFSVGASATATGLFLTVEGLLNDKLGKYGVHATLGTKLLSISWVATAFGVAAALFWTCGCCCGKERENKMKRGRSFKSNDAYERVPSPYKTHGHSPSHGTDAYHMQQSQNYWPRQQTGTAYEPYRAV